MRDNKTVFGALPYIHTLHGSDSIAFPVIFELLECLVAVNISFEQ